MNTRVDSPLAEYYLEDYSRGNAVNETLNQQLYAIESHLGPGVPDGEALEWITHHYSRDVATIYLLERLASDPVNRQFNEAYERQLALVTSSGIDPGAASMLKSDVLFLVVPGWYWRNESFDGTLEGPRQFLEQFGYHTQLLPTDDKGSVECNAALIASRLQQLRQQGKLVVLVSVSKGSAEAALALGQLLSWEESQHVLAWINVNGGLRGSPLADKLLRWPHKLVTRLGLLLAYHDSGAGLKSMRTDLRRQVFDSLQLPPHVLTVNLTAVPFSGQVNRRSRGIDRLLNDYGPHDGSLLTRDELIDDAPTVTELGFDHYFFDPMIGVKSLALVRTLEELIAVSPGQLTPAVSRPYSTAPLPPFAAAGVRERR